MRKNLTWLAAAGGLMSAAACTPKPEATVEALQAALIAAEPERVLELLSADYADAGGDASMLGRELGELFTQSPRTEFQFKDPACGREGPEVDCGGELRVLTNGRPEIDFVGPLALRLRSVGAHWRVAAGVLSDFRGIVRVARARRAALEANDSAAYAELLDPSYRDGDLDRGAAQERLRRDMTGLAVRMDPLHWRIDVRGPTAIFEERYTLRVGEQEFSDRRGRLRLARSATVGAWKIQAGLYAAAGP